MCKNCWCFCLECFPIPTRKVVLKSIICFILSLTRSNFDALVQPQPKNKAWHQMKMCYIHLQHNRKAILQILSKRNPSPLISEIFLYHHGHLWNNDSQVFKPSLKLIAGEDRKSGLEVLSIIHYRDRPRSRPWITVVLNQVLSQNSRPKSGLDSGPDPGQDLGLDSLLKTSFHHVCLPGDQQIAHQKRTSRRSMSSHMHLQWWLCWSYLRANHRGQMSNL